jgi:hypothetical protein
MELVPPVAFEPARPFVEGPDALRVRSIEHLPPFAPDVDEADVQQHPKMFRDRGLRQAERRHDVADRTLASRQIVQNVSTTRLGNRIEGV